MSACTIIDLAAARTRRAALEAEVAGHVGDIIDRVTEMSTIQADRAFLVSGPLMGQEPDIARCVNRYIMRRLRALVRSVVKSPAFAEHTQIEFVDFARDVFTARLVERRDEMRGRAHG